MEGDLWDYDYASDCADMEDDEQPKKCKWLHHFEGVQCNGSKYSEGICEGTNTEAHCYEV